MNRLAIIFNTCGINEGRNLTSHVDKYVERINTIFEQDITDSHVFISSCLNSVESLQYVKSKVNGPLTVNLIKEKLPVNVTFNHTALKAREIFGEFEGYLYVDSGVSFVKPTDISVLYDLLAKNEYAMVAARASSDNGYQRWFGNNLNSSGDFEIPIGKTVNMHCQVFSKDVLDVYGYLDPDIYAGFCSESVFSFMCSALGKKFVLSKDVTVSHLTGLDGPSAAFFPPDWEASGNVTYDHPFLVDSVVDIAKKGYEFGFGYEECQHIVDHDPNKYDGFFCKDDRLKGFIRDNQFVGNLGLLDFKTIDSEVLHV
jgi:hypothetical protein